MEQHDLIDLLAGTAVVAALAQRAGDPRLLKGWLETRPAPERKIAREFLALVKTTSALLNKGTN